MQKIIFDTNVLVSSIIQKSYPYLIVRELFFEDKLSLCLSASLMQEYWDVLFREKFSKYSAFYFEALDLLEEISDKAIFFSPKTNIDLLGDKDDNMLLELASESNADFLITGNSNDFTISKYRETLIVNPKNYWENYKPTSVKLI
ncbi:MAG: putative toxin-antitoxin system toxin component, PIN family [Fibromonadaceae bacterium]|jgi:putative PIN family toxin of toxin-antitoxin system|nr:putative toxin-antitoxin system toxin component, PIN family [Fibromonadaceae bacterium]